MDTLVELSSTKHKNLCISEDASANFASTQHIMHIRAIEIANASSCFPVFASRSANDGSINFSAMTSFEAGKNLFVKDKKWLPIFTPLSVQTHPIYLMQSPRDEKSYTFGLVETSDDFTTSSGVALFDASGKPSERLTLIQKNLQASVEHDIKSQQFSKALDKLDLFKELDLNVQYEDGQLQKIQGLQTINEDRLQTLSAEELMGLHEKGYLTPLHAMLVSLFQVNVLINKHNASNPSYRVVHVKMEVRKDTQAV